MDGLELDINKLLPQNFEQRDRLPHISQPLTVISWAFDTHNLNNPITFRVIHINSDDDEQPRQRRRRDPRENDAPLSSSYHLPHDPHWPSTPAPLSSPSSLPHPPPSPLSPQEGEILLTQDAEDPEAPLQHKMVKSQKIVGEIVTTIYQRRRVHQILT